LNFYFQSKVNFFRPHPGEYTLQLQAMSAEKLKFNLTAVFTIGPKDEPKALEKYAKILATTEKNTDHVKDLVSIIKGETRVLAAAMIIE
jgi:flotillin